MRSAEPAEEVKEVNDAKETKEVKEVKETKDTKEAKEPKKDLHFLNDLFFWWHVGALLVLCQFSGCPLSTQTKVNMNEQYELPFVVSHIPWPEVFCMSVPPMLQENDPSKEAPKKKAAPTEEKKKEAKPAPKKQDSSFTCNSNLTYRRVFDFPFLPSSFCRSFFRFPVQEPNLTDEAWDCQFIEGWMDEESDLIDWLVLIVYDCSSILSYDVGWCWHVLAANWHQNPNFLCAWWDWSQVVTQIAQAKYEAQICTDMVFERMWTAFKFGGFRFRRVQGHLGKRQHWNEQCLASVRSSLEHPGARRQAERCRTPFDGTHQILGQSE